MLLGNNIFDIIFIPHFRNEWNVFISTGSAVPIIPIYFN